MIKWDNLPDAFKNEEVRPYYDRLQKRKLSIGIKKVLDILLALVLFIILLPIMFIIGVLVGTTSKGGVFYCQERVTTYGRHFKIIKFRTMVSGADRKGTLVTTDGDSRVTKVGKFLRKVRLDELPQLINIIKGDMSIVGTRPEVPRYVEQYSKEMYATLLLPAGVTSRASIQYKDEDRLLAEGKDVEATYVNVVLPEKMKYNLSYLKDFSLVTDFKLMVQTVFAVWR